MEINKFVLKRVNPFQGLVIDADTWQDAHNYHRDQQKLHILAFHDTGIVSGLELTAGETPDYSVSINAGMAIDPEGNVIIVPQKQRYRLKTPSEKGIIYLIIQFREIPGEPYQPAEGGQPTRILEAYRIQERDFLPSEPYVELGRVEFDPGQPAIRNAARAEKPGLNEIDLRYRKSARQAAAAPAAAAAATPPPAVSTPPPAPVVSAPPAPAPAAPVTPAPAPRETFYIGYAVLGGKPADSHLRGLKNTVRTFNRYAEERLAVEEQVNLNKSLKRYSLLYLTGGGNFDLTAEQLLTLKDFLKSGGIILGDGCSRINGDVKGIREFGLAFNRLAGRLECKLEMVTRGHPLLSGENLFSEVPAGCEAPLLLEGGNMICSNSDYGCAWDGGYSDQPLPRETIRSAFELAADIFSLALKARTGSR